MSVTVAQVVAGLKDKINDITGLRAFEYVPEDLNPPCAVVVLGPIERGAFSRGMMELTVEVAIFVTRGSDRAGQASLNAFADPSASVSTSVWAKIDADKTLGITGVDAAVLRYRPFGIDEVAAYGYYGGVFELLVLVTNP
jgi:hypothetical protein